MFYKRHKKQEAETVLRKFTKSMLTFCFPRHIFTDHGTQFTSRLAIDSAKTFGMVCVYRSKFNPRSNGQTENMNKIVFAMLAKICKTLNADDWDGMLPYVQAAHNSTPHSVTSYKPFMLLFGHDFKKPSSFILDAVPSPYVDNHDSWIDNMKGNLA